MDGEEPVDRPTGPLSDPSAGPANIRPRYGGRCRLPWLAASRGTAKIVPVVHPGDAAAAAALPPFGGAGRLYTLPRHDVSVDGLRQAGLAGRHRPHVPYPTGPTHPSNNDMLLPISSPAQDLSLRAGRRAVTHAARRHRWSLRRRAVGSTSPNRWERCYFRNLPCPPRNSPCPTSLRPVRTAGLAMPKRKRTRAEERARQSNGNAESTEHATRPTRHRSDGSAYRVPLISRRANMFQRR